MKKIMLSIVFMAFSIINIMDAQNLPKSSMTGNWNYEVKGGINIGGAAPLSMPVEIRSLDSYNPRLNGMIEGDVTRWFGVCQHWGVTAGLRLESKRMRTGATVKNYQTEVVDDGSKVSGYWTGYVNTKYSTVLLTVPVTADFRLNSRWTFRGGAYLSYVLGRDFSGYVTDGYLRQGTPVGQKIQFVDGKQGTYDFSDNLRRFQPGLQVGASWMANQHFCINADFDFGICDIFESSFKTVTFDMYPLYLNIGCGYKF